LYCFLNKFNSVVNRSSQKNELNGYGALNELKELLGDAVTLVVETIEKHINCFFVQALQLKLTVPFLKQVLAEETELESR
jgi:hypothetical protein